MTTELPPIPGGWTTERILVDGATLDVTRPADPDAFLDDPATIAENQASDYMPYWPYLWPAAYKMAELVANADWRAARHVAAANVADAASIRADSGSFRHAAAAASGGTEAGSFRHVAAAASGATEARSLGYEVLEIGCGIGLVGMAALLRGDRVTFSDNRAEAVALSLHNAARNGLTRCRGKLLDWNEPPDETYDVILGSEVVYERRYHAPILDLVAAMLSCDGVCRLGDAGRHVAHLFTADARARGWRVALFDAEGHIVPDHDAGKFRLIELRRAV